MLTVGKIIRQTLTRTSLLILLVTTAYATADNASTFPPDQTLTYRQVGDIDLSIDLFGVDNVITSPRPAILFFHGGAWTDGSPAQFYPWASHFADLGWIAASAQYRLHGHHGTDAFDAVNDARAAYLYLQQHAAALGIDPQRIVVAGSSSGGHLAATIAMTPWPERSTAPLPQALVLLNPVLDTIYEASRPSASLFSGNGEQISPMHHVVAGLPPTLIVQGTEDAVVPLADSKKFCARMQEASNECHVAKHKGVGHGFFNWGHGYFDEVLSEIVDFTENL